MARALVPLQRVRGEVKEHLAGERVVSRVQGRKRAQYLEDVSVAGEPALPNVRASQIPGRERGCAGGRGGVVEDRDPAVWEVAEGPLGERAEFARLRCPVNDELVVLVGRRVLPVKDGHAAGNSRTTAA